MRKVLWLVLFLLGQSSVISAAEVKTEKTSDGWRLLVDGQPFFIKGMCYNPTTIGETADDRTRRNWMDVDDDQDSRNDFAYQTWVDANRNNQRDSDEREIGDFELMRQMGVNTIRIYHHATDDPILQEINRQVSSRLNGPRHKKLLRELHEKYSIWVAMGDLLGAYTVSSGALWRTGTDYTNPLQRFRMLKSVKDMVMTYKDEPYLLIWILGNENNLEDLTHTNASREAEAYAGFVNEAALLIKQLDGHHPVAISNGAYGLLQDYAKFTPDVDIFGTNLYQNHGFQELWKKVASIYDRPVMLTEFGTAHPVIVDGKLLEEPQARIHRLAWQDIAKHEAGGALPPDRFPEGGNAIGGFVFEWVDEWWHNGDKWHQNLNPANNGWNAEYNGMTSLGDGSAGSLMRQLRKVYGTYQELWQKN